MDISKTTRPEEKLLSSVIALAIEDVSLPPIQITILESVGLKRRKKKILVPCSLAESAYKFLFQGGADGYCAALDIDPKEFKIRLLIQLKDTSTNRPFDLSKRSLEMISRKKRNFKLNHDLFNRGNLRGNFTEFVNSKFHTNVLEEEE
jgi:hypothetical protein